MILFGTLGFTPGKLLPSIRRATELERVVVFHDKARESRDAYRAVAQYCNDQKTPVDSVELDAFDLVEDAVRIRREFRRFPDRDVVVNLTGGTGILTSAAMLAAILEGKHCVYLKETTEDEIPLPLLRIRYDRLINRQQRRILESVRDIGPDCTQRDIVATTKLSKPNVNHHVKRLSQMGLLAIATDPKDGRRKLLRLAPSSRLLLPEE